MKLLETFLEYNLTDGQKELLENLENFLDGSESCFILKGYAGTGKTFMMKGLTDYFKLIGRPFVLAAPTGRAAKVISQRTHSNAYTIHKTIYSNNDIKEYKIENLDGSETFKFYYELKNNEDEVNTVYIIDEASMLSDIYSESEFFRFGSGFLLKDLISYINFGNNNQKKVIFIGDNAQLPPVNMNFSPALDSEYLKNEYNVLVESYELIEVLRQQKDSGILHNATEIREALKINTFNQIDIKTNFGDIKPVQSENFLATYLHACAREIDDETIIIAYSNALVKEYNDFVRKHFFPNENYITENDRVILVNNNYNYQIELLNGDFGIVKSVNPTVETKITTLAQKDREGKTIEKKISITFRNIVIEFKDVNNIPYQISCKIIENLLYSKERGLNSDEQKALYIDFWVRNPQINEIRQLLHAKSINFDKLKDLVSNLSINDINQDILDKIREFENEYFTNPQNDKIRSISIAILRDVLKSDPYFNALRIKFGYAITCHKAQGGEWKRAFVNCKTGMGYFNASYFRWLYTAITRAKETLFTINEPHFKIGSMVTISNFTQRNDIITLPHDILENNEIFNFGQEQYGLRNIFYSIFDLLKDEGVAFSKLEHNSYHEIYSLAKESDLVRFKVNYKKDFKISSIKEISNNELTKLLLDKLRIIENKIIVIEDKNTITTINQKEFGFPESKPFLKIFFDEIKEKVNTQFIEVVEIEHKDYHEIYKFQRGNQVAFYKFWYNKEFKFGNAEIIINRTTGLISEINSLLNYNS